MDWFSSIVLGLVQGITEFFPISSSGHLHLVQVWFDMEPDLALEIWLHMATLFAIVVLFWKDILRLVLGFLSLLKLPVKGDRDEGVLALKLGIASVITAGLALLLEPYFTSILTSTLVAGTLLVTAFLIMAAEEFRPKKERDFTWMVVLVLGAVQALALFPGISRSGITIAVLVMLGIARKESARLSFLLAIPTILGAFVFAFFDPMYGFEFTPYLLLSGVVAFLAALVGMKWMMKLIEGKWKWFSLYCFLLGGGILVYELFL